MGLLQKLLGMRTDRALMEVAGKVAAESQTLVWPMLQPWVGELRSTSEAQAFVRARIRRVVRHQLYRVMDRRDWAALEREEVILNQALSILAGQYASRLMARVPATSNFRRAA
jgi:hypothetical protein